MALSPQATPQTPAVQVPTREQLEAQLTSMAMKRSQMKDEVEVLEKQMPSIAAMIQLLTSQEQLAKQKAEVTKD